MPEGIIKGVSGDSYVLTGRGYRKAETIEPGDIVYSAEMKPVEVIAVSERIGTGYSIHASSTVDFTISGESVLFCLDKAHEHRKWMTVEDALLSTDEYFNIGVPVVRDTEPFPWEGVDFCDGYHMRKRRNLNPDDPRLWYVVGNYARSGTPRRNLKRGSLGRKYEGVLISYPDGPEYPRAKEISSAIIRSSIATRSGKQVHAFYSGIEIAEFLIQFGEKTRGRLLPSSILSLSPELLKAFVSGYRRAEWPSADDGKDELFRIVSVNSSLILMMLHIIEKAYGTVPLVHTTRNNAPRRFGDRVVEMSDYHNLDAHTAPGGSRSFIMDDTAWYPVRNVVKAENTRLIEFILSEDSGLTVSHAAIR